MKKKKGKGGGKRRERNKNKNINQNALVHKINDHERVVFNPNGGLINVLTSVGDFLVLVLEYLFFLPYTL